MAAVPSMNSRPEMIVRRMIHSMGFRYRLHVRELPGTPDIVLPRHGKVVFVHGCFWHRHKGCRFASEPATRAAFWHSKFEGNIARDRRAARQLRCMGWKVLTIWQCECRKPDRLRAKLEKFLCHEA